MNKKNRNRPADLIDLVGGYGPWQRDIFIMFFFGSFPSSWQGLGVSFFAADMDHWCARPPNSNLTVEEWKNYSIPKEVVNGVYKHSNCKMYNQFRNETVECQKWEYDTSVFTSTIVSQWDLVCDREWYASFSQAIYMAGFMLAVLIFGQLSDRFGRRPIILLSIGITFVAGLIGAFSVNFAMYAASRFLVAMGASGLFTAAFVVLVEIVGPEYRSFFGIAIEFGWATGYILLPCLAWLINDWHYLQLALSIPVILLVTFWWWVPESPRWLLSQGRLEECEAILKKAASKNGKDATNLGADIKTFYKAAEKEQEMHTVKRYTILDLLKYSNMRKKTLNIYFNWCVNAFVYYALSLNTGELGGSIFINFFIAGAVEFPAYVVSIIVIKHIGRKIPLMAAMIIGGLACLLIIPIPNYLLWVKITLAMVGKFCLTASFGIIYVFSAELFPTVVRNVGVGSSSTFARVGSIVAPFGKDLGRATYVNLPLIIYGVISMVAGALVVLLPETNNKPVPDTIEEAEQISRKLPCPTKTELATISK
ncbi:organic cation transporter protein-like [Centruroides vittatus]|uniref:organic cation transporter protein-like n=1 Tax=Centruroides vittatus TaxID=120091 RepID=UPI0035104FFA